MSEKRKVKWAASSFFEDNPQPIESKKIDVQLCCSKSGKQEQAKIAQQPACSKIYSRERQCSSRMVDFGVVSENFDLLYQKDLAMSKKRLEPLQQWFDELGKSAKGNKILLLLGPDGCGKTEAVKVLAREKEMEVVEWSEPDFIPGVDEYTPYYDMNNLGLFLLHAGRYTKSKQLIVVEDLPLAVLTAKKGLATVIHKYSITGKVPLILIISRTDLYSVFSAEAQKMLDMDVIMFKRITDTCIKKALNRIVRLKNLPCADYEHIVTQITELACGNIRKAVSELKFYVPESKFVNPCKGQLKFRKQLAGKSNSKAAESELKDDSGIFHAVARVLYAKRETVSVKRGHSMKYSSTSSGELEHKPVEICDKYFQFRKQFVNLMFCNYAKIFCNIQDIANAAGYLSESDLLTSLWLEKPISQDAGFAVAVGGVMTSCHSTEKKWHPLKTDGGLSEHNSISPQIMWEVRRIWPAFASLSERIMCTEIIPFLLKMSQDCSVKVPQCNHGFFTHDHTQFVLQMKHLKQLQKQGFQRLPNVPHRVFNTREVSSRFDTETKRQLLEEHWRDEQEDEELRIEEISSD